MAWLISAVNTVLLIVDASDLREAEKVRASQEKALQALQHYTLAHYPEIPSKFGELLLRIPELQRTCQVSWFLAAVVFEGVTHGKCKSFLVVHIKKEFLLQLMCNTEVRESAFHLLQHAASSQTWCVLDEEYETIIGLFLVFFTWESQFSLCPAIPLITSNIEPAPWDLKQLLYYIKMSPCWHLIVLHYWIALWIGYWINVSTISVSTVMFSLNVSVFVSHVSRLVRRCYQ